jgi:integrase
MPTERSNGRYYIKRKVPGIGDVYRSLHTDRKGLARKREDMLLALAAQGRQDVVRAWLDGELALARLQEAYETGEVHELARTVRRGDSTLRAACEAALRDKGPDVADSTLERYTTGLDHFRAFCGDDASVRESLTTDVIQAFKAHRLDEDDVAKETVNNDLGAVSILCTYAKRKGWIDTRPEIKKFSSKVRITYLESDQIAAYMAALRRPFRPLFQLLVGTGMRLGEAESLEVKDLRLGNGEMRALIEDAKTASGIRAVFIPEWVAETLRDHLDDTGQTGQEPLFEIPRRTVQKEHNRACGIVGIHGYTIHDHRHTAAVHLARAGMPLHLLQQQLGHKNIDQTMRYARFHPDYGDMEEYFERVGRELGLGAESAPTMGNSSGNTPASEEVGTSKAEGV